MTLKLAETEPLKMYNLTLATEYLEACSCYTVHSRDYWACAMRQETSTMSHEVGSCKMGPAADPMAVVDPKLQVYGIKNLRVVDASIMPKVNFNLLSADIFFSQPWYAHVT